MESVICDVLVVGAGPGGYVAAIRAGQLGLDTVIVEGERSGGTCLIRGCIPSKAFIHAASKVEEMNSTLESNAMGISLNESATIDMDQFQVWKDDIVIQLEKGVDHLLKKNSVRRLSGWATFVDAKTCHIKNEDITIKVTAKNVILATGSAPSQLPKLSPSERVVTSTEALNIRDIPDHLVVVGAGYIGLELGSAFSKLGSRVTFLEAADRILSTYDPELTKPVEQWLSKQGVEVVCGARLNDCLETDDLVKLSYTDNCSEVHQFEADRVLLTVGRTPNLHGWGFENMCVDTKDKFVVVDEYCQTTMRGVWAIGDITGEPMLAHKASAQGRVVAEKISGMASQFDPVCIPAVCFTEPEIVSVGMTPTDASKKGLEVVVSRHPYRAVGKALTMNAGNDGGFLRITARKDNHLVLGIQAVGAHVAELSGEFSLALEMGATLEDLANTIHMHPSLNEAVGEAALAGLGNAIHF